MRHPNPIQISIPHPCNQSWDEMTPDGQGRHCAHCQKTVIDFTTWSDTALYNYLSKDTGNNCGRFLVSQVNRPIHIPHQPHSRLYRMTIALGLALMFTQTPHLLAQTRPPIAVQTLITDTANKPTESVAGISGQINDEKKEPLISATIQVFQQGVLKGGAVTDYDGNYKIAPLEPGYYDILVLYYGYDSLKQTGVVVGAGTNVTVNLTMQRSRGQNLREMHTMGGYRTPLINRDKETIQPMSAPKDPSLPEPVNSTPSKKTLNRKDIEHMPR